MENETQDQQINQTPVTSPSQPVSPAPKSRLSIIFGGVLLLLLMCGVAYYFVVSKNTSKQQVLSPSPIPTTSVQATSIPTQTISVIKLLDAWQLGTRMYSNPKIDITFEYPSFFELHETDIQKENADWQAKYKNDPNVKQPLYTSSFAASFSTPNQESAAT